MDQPFPAHTLMEQREYCSSFVIQPQKIREFWMQDLALPAGILGLALHKTRIHGEIDYQRWELCTTKKKGKMGKNS